MIHHQNLKNEEPSIYRLTPIFEEKLWGGHRIARYFETDASAPIGEAHLVSAHGKFVSKIENGPFKDQTLAWLYEHHPEYFGYWGSKEFPLIIKLIDANEALSIQVHPNDFYAKKFEGGNGKNEAWVVLDAPSDGQLLIGHRAPQKPDLEKALHEGNFHTYINRLSVSKGDYFYIPSGTLHAIDRGLLIYEIQQNSAITYRLYDYDRTDAQGNKRPLHLEKGLEVLDYPNTIRPEKTKTIIKDTYQVTDYPDNPYFKLTRYTVQGHACIELNSPFGLIGILEGSGIINANSVRPMDHFMVPTQTRQLSISGDLSIMVIQPK